MSKLASISKHCMQYEIILLLLLFNRVCQVFTGRVMGIQSDTRLFVVVQTSMKDRWMNIGYEDDELRPYQEPNKLKEEQLIGKICCCCCYSVACTAAALQL